MPISALEYSQRLAVLMSLQEGSLASLRALSDKCAVLQTSVGCGPKPSEWLALYDPSSGFLRIRQRSLFSTTGGPGTELCQDWSRSGMICGGMYFPRPRLVRDICENDSSSSLPTVTSNDGLKRGEAYWKEKRESDDMGSWNQGDTLPRKIAKLLPTLVSADGKRGPDYARANREGSGGDDLVTTLAKLLPTPTTRDYKDTPGMARTATNKDGSERNRDDQLPRRIYAGESVQATGGMRLTPEFQCWLMGYPPNWLKPLRDALATRSSRKCSSP